MTLNLGSCAPCLPSFILSASLSRFIFFISILYAQTPLWESLLKVALLGWAKVTVCMMPWWWKAQWILCSFWFLTSFWIYEVPILSFRSLSFWYSLWRHWFLLPWPGRLCPVFRWGFSSGWGCFRNCGSFLWRIHSIRLWLCQWLWWRCQWQLGPCCWGVGWYLRVAWIFTIYTPQNSILTLKLMDSKIWFQKSCMFGTTFQSVAFDVPIYLSYLNHFCKIEKPMASTTTSSHSPSRREALKFWYVLIISKNMRIGLLYV